MGHCRGAVVGDSLARLLEAAGFRVTKEYYVNDAGAQVDTLARSVHLRYREALGEEIGEIAEGLYPGDYLKPVGTLLAGEYRRPICGAPESEWLDLFASAGGRSHARPDPARSRFARRPSRPVRVGARGSGVGRGRPRDEGARRAGPGLSRHAAAAPRQDRRGMGAGGAAPVPVDASSATTRIDRSRNRTAAGPISAADTAYHLQKLENSRDIWSTSGAPTMPAP